MARKSRPPDGLVTLRTAAEICGCPTDVRLIPDLVRMRLMDEVILVIRGERYVKVADFDYIRGWVQWWDDRPMRSKRRER